VSTISKPTGAKEASALNKAKNLGVEHRELLARADECDNFAKELLRLVKRSMQCSIDGPQPLPDPGLADASLTGDGVRLRVERASASVSAKRSREHHELLVLQATLAELAKLHQQWSKAYKIWAGPGIGRPRDKEKVLTEVRAVFAFRPKVKAIKKTGRPRLVDLSDHDLARRVLPYKVFDEVTWRRAAWLAAKDYLIETGHLAPNAAEWRVNNEVPPMASNIEKRISTMRARLRKLRKNSPD
jgi:hypothetical protein